EKGPCSRNRSGNQTHCGARCALGQGNVVLTGRVTWCGPAFWQAQPHSMQRIPANPATFKGPHAGKPTGAQTCCIPAACQDLLASVGKSDYIWLGAFRPRPPYGTMPT